MAATPSRRSELSATALMCSGRLSRPLCLPVLWSRAKPNLVAIRACLAVARERRFTRAAAKLGVSQSALSHTIRGLEARLDLRLLTRTTRSVATTAAGERLLRSVGPRFEDIEAELEALGELREKP